MKNSINSLIWTLLLMASTFNIYANGNDSQENSLKDQYLPVANVDLKRYLGNWYEIARFDQSFQKGCTASVANYELRSDGDISVTNSCRLNNPSGKLKTAKARAWVVDDSNNAKLKVQFFLRAFRIPILAGDYWILDIGPNYEYAIVGDPSRKYLWFLSRTKNISEKLYQELVATAKDLHFDTSKLIRTDH